MAEFLRPDADVSIGGWTTQSGGTTNLFDALNESSPDDADYIISSPDPVADIYRFRISDPTSILEDGTVRYRYEKTGSGTANVTARLIQGSFPTTWNPSDKSANITLSGNDLVATFTSDTEGAVRSIASTSTNLVYFELTVSDAQSVVDWVVGIANGTWPLNNYPGEDNNSVGWLSDGTVYRNGSIVATVAGYALSNLLRFALDAVNDKLWLAVNTGGWNNDVIGNQNPATNTGGIDLSALAAGPYFAAFYTIGGNGDDILANFGLGGFAQTKPTGFVSLGSNATIAEWEHTDITASFVDAEQTLTSPQFDSITDFYDLFGELEASSGVAAYDPSADAGLVAWWKADATGAGGGPKDAGGNTPDDAEAMDDWNDSSGHGYELLSISGVDTVLFNTNSLNGLPGVTFDAAQNGGRRTFLNEVTLNSTTLTVIVLVKSLTGADSNARFFSLLGGASTLDYDNNKSLCIVQAGGTTEQLYTYGNGAQTGTGSNSAFAFGTARTIALKYDGTECQRWIAGVEQGTGTAWTTALGNTVAKGIMLMSNFNGTENAEGTVYEVIVTTTVLNLSLGGPVDNYVFPKWGVH